MDLTETAAVVCRSTVALGSFAVPPRFRFGPNEGIPQEDRQRIETGGGGFWPGAASVMGAHCTRLEASDRSRVGCVTGPA